MGSVGVSSFFSLDDLKMSLFLYKLGIKPLQVSDVHGIYIQLNIMFVCVCMCVLYCVFENHKNLCKFGFVGSDVQTFLFL